MSSLARSLICLSALVTWLSQPAYTAIAADAVRWLPADVNAVLVIDVAAAYRSPIAVQNQWAKKAAASFLSQELFLPPTAERVTVGAQLDWQQNLTSVQQNIVMEMKPGTDLASIAPLIGGEVEKNGTRSGLSLEKGRYVIEAAPQLWLMAQPGGRQAGWRWARVGIKPAAQPPLFLVSAAESVTAEAPIVVVLDLTDAVDLKAARAVLEDLPGSPLKGAALEAAAKVLTTVKGVVCQVTLSDKRLARCRIEFDQSPAVLSSHAMPLAQTVLSQWGATLEDTTGWKTRTESFSLVYEGEISGTGLKRLISVVQPSIVPSAETPTAEAVPTAALKASQKYFRSVQHELDDLRTSLRKTRDNHALWLERSARTIDGLPLKDVDQDLQVFGGRVSRSLRYQAQAERQGNLRTGTRQAQAQTNTFYNGVGSYGEVYQNVPGGNAAAISAEEGEASRNVRNSEWKLIEDGLAEIRRTMTQRYQAEF